MYRYVLLLTVSCKKLRLSFSGLTLSLYAQSLNEIKFSYNGEIQIAVYFILFEAL